MRTISLLFGILLLLPSAAAAQSQRNTDAVINSQYLDPVFQRIRDGRAQAKKSGADITIITLLQWWFPDLVAGALQFSDTDIRIVREQNDLTGTTPCLAHDLQVLRAVEDQVHEEYLQAYRQRRMGAMLLLSDLMVYAADRERMLLAGGTDPGLVDRTFAQRMSFDADTWCCSAKANKNACELMEKTACTKADGRQFPAADECAQTCTDAAQPPPNSPMCPFHSDYLPPTPAGYGCDAAALERIGYKSERRPISLDSNPQTPNLRQQKSSAGATQEFSRAAVNEATAQAAMEDTLQDVNPLVSRLRGILELEQELFGSSGADPDGLRTLQLGDHNTRIGCSQRDVPASRSAASASNSAASAPSTDSEPAPDAAVPNGAARTVVRGSFSLQKDTLRLLQEFELLQQRLAERLPLPKELQYAADFPRRSPAWKSALERFGTLNVFETLDRLLRRPALQEFQTEQLLQEAPALFVFVESKDPFAAQFHDAVQSFTQVVGGAQSGPRAFATGLASYLRRSCVFRPCSKLLERIVSLSTTDACFPVTKDPLGTIEECTDEVE